MEGVTVEEVCDKSYNEILILIRISKVNYFDGFYFIAMISLNLINCGYCKLSLNRAVSN